jgi:bifunctional non-homologous end joining protein LigD
VANVLRSIALFFQEGTSDKVYNVALVDEGGGLATVKVEWGRRGAPLATGAKAAKVPRAAAEKAYDKVVREKRGKGYEEVTTEVQPAAVAPPLGLGSASKAGVADRRARTGQAAQLLNVIEEDEVERLLADPRWVAQQKLDGMRLLVHVGEELVGSNRSGQVVAMPRAIADAVAAAGLPAGTILDGELVSDGGPVYWIFDLLQLGEEDLRRQGYLERYGWLEDLVLAPPLALVPVGRTTAQKRALLARLRADSGEGIVLKRVDAPYTAGRPASGGTQLKHKFVKTADVFLTANAGNAYQMAVMDGRAVHEAGRVFSGTTSEIRAEIDRLITAGERPVVEVRYLYATDDDILYQPVFVRLRDDKEPEDCTRAQLVRTSRRAVEGHEVEAAPEKRTRKR